MEFLLISFLEFLLLVLMMVHHHHLHQYHLVLVLYLIVYQVLIVFQYLHVPEEEKVENNLFFFLRFIYVRIKFC